MQNQTVDVCCFEIGEGRCEGLVDLLRDGERGIIGVEGGIFAFLMRREFGLDLDVGNSLINASIR